MRKLLADRLGSRPLRRASLPRFRGQFEPLESRTVLSATIGVMAVDVDANTVSVAVAVWESPSLPTAWLQKAPLFNAYGSANLPWGREAGDPFFQQHMIGTPGNGRADGSTFFPEDFESRTKLTRDKNQPIMAQAESEPDPTTGALNFPTNFPGTAGFVDSALTRFRNTRTLPTGLLVEAAALATPSTTVSLLSEPSHHVATDADFDRHTNDSLLLAAAENLDDADSVDDKFGDAESLDDSEQSLDESADTLVEEEVAASLDALQRERMAIDAVLAKLHDVKLNDGHELHPSATEQRRTTDSRTAAIEQFSAEERNTQTRDAVPVDGGMVLLQPTGDPNRSAYDLTDVFFARLGGDEHATLAVEASLGMYQAIDVGSQPAVSRTPLPIAQPAQNGSPSVSAENAPAKKSEQRT